MQGANVETVVKLRSSDEKLEANALAAAAAAATGGSNMAAAEHAPAGAAQAQHENEEIPKLVDSKDNQFVLSKGSDSTVPHEDHYLIKVR